MSPAPDPSPAPHRPERRFTVLPWVVAGALGLAALWGFSQYAAVRVENRVLRQQQELSELALKSARTQLEAGQILTSHLAAGYHPPTSLPADRTGHLAVTLLVPAEQRAPAMAAALAWDTASLNGRFEARGLPALPDGLTYGLWAVDRDPHLLGRFAADAQGNVEAKVALPPTLDPSARFVLARDAVKDMGKPGEPVLRSP
ncbi:MAG TPA: hypothetical protein VHE61_19035 [Opitutaceae bacterium]|nr:hypothetical protein [Opitutaceae bacterium]